MKDKILQTMIQAEEASKTNTKLFRESANSLFNFMGKLDYIKKAINEMALFPRYVKEDVSYLHLKIKDENAINHIALPMLCFCDINLHQLKYHLGTYGHCGIGINKQWAIDKYGVQPVNYVSKDSPVTNDLSIGFNSFLKNSEEDNPDEGNALLTILKYSKPVFGNMVEKKDGISDPNGESKPKNFYDEHEWRYIPPITPGSNFEFLNDGLPAQKILMDPRRLNILSDHIDKMKLSLDNINYIFVKNDQDVHELSKFIMNCKCLKEFCKISLLTKIINLEKLGEDV